MGADPRIGRAFLSAGLGYGGYCFPKDVAALGKLSSRLGYAFPLLDEVERLNEEAVGATVAKVEDALWNLEGKRIAILGLAFKPNTDDIRFSPALVLASRLLAAGSSVAAYDPQAAVNAKRELPELEISDSPYEAADGARCLVLATEWDQFRHLDLVKVRERMESPIIVDARNALDRESVLAAGFVAYYPIGKPAVTGASADGDPHVSAPHPIDLSR
jgi:UDPglucose 6-dehydrogenase